MNDFPVNLSGYFYNSPDFEERQNNTKKAIAGIVALFGLFLLIKAPGVAGFLALLVRLIGLIILAGAGLALYMGFTDYYNLSSGGKMQHIAVKKFDSSQISEEEILNLFASNNFQGLANAADQNDQPIQLYVYQDDVEKSFYVQIMKYFSSSEFKGATEIYIVKW